MRLATWAGATTPIPLLKKAGVAVAQPDTVRGIIEQLDDLVPRLEEELATLQRRRVGKPSPAARAGWT